MNDTAKYFQQNKYVVIKNFLDSNTSNLFYNYCVNKVLKNDFLRTQSPEDFREEMDGIFGDGMTINESYACYADDLMDTLLQSSLQSMEQITGMKLSPQYSYWRMYEQGDDLQAHIDRESCEISTTLCLGYNTANLKSYIWPFYIKSLDNKDLKIELEPGDMLVYKGCEVEHWRDTFKGLNHAQVFMHYNDVNGPYNKLYDTRPLPCLPAKFRNFNGTN